MADALLSVVLEQIAKIIADELKGNVSLVVEVKSQVERLESDLKAIRNVSLDAEKKQLSSDVLKQWLADLKDASYDIVTVLDEWTTSVEKAQLESGEESRDYIRKTKVCFSLFFCCLCGSKQGQYIFRKLKIAEKIRDLQVNIGMINERKEAFKLETTSISEEREWRYTDPHLPGPVVQGNYEEKRSLIKQLIEIDDTIRFISIVGMGGIGKTTLAKHVYNDTEVQKEFPRRVWVCVSQPFDLEQIAKEVVEQLTVQAPGSGIGRTALMQKLCEAISQEKFLLVLDDVWTVNTMEWDPLGNVLKEKGGTNGNRVIVTTRSDDVVRMIGDERVVRVKQLLKEDCWLLLKVC